MFTQELDNYVNTRDGMGPYGVKALAHQKSPKWPVVMDVHPQKMRQNHKMMDDGCYALTPSYTKFLDALPTSPCCSAFLQTRHRN